LKIKLGQISCDLKRKRRDDFDFMGQNWNATLINPLGQNHFYMDKLFLG
jgi:hypothetical protein